MFVEIVKSYSDKLLRRDVKAGEMLPVDDERGEFLIAHGKARRIDLDESASNAKIDELLGIIAEKDVEIARLNRLINKAK